LFSDDQSVHCFRARRVALQCPRIGCPSPVYRVRFEALPWAGASTGRRPLLRLGLVVAHVFSLPARMRLSSLNWLGLLQVRWRSWHAAQGPKRAPALRFRLAGMPLTQPAPYRPFVCRRPMPEGRKRRATHGTETCVRGTSHRYLLFARAKKKKKQKKKKKKN